MVEVIWSPSALRDVEQIADFIARDSADHAALFVSRLLSATDHLAKFPRSGKIIREIGDPECREIRYGAYRILYRLNPGEAWITGVVHGARDRR